jgi:LysM repeat protein
MEKKHHRSKIFQLVGKGLLVLALLASSIPAAAAGQYLLSGDRPASYTLQPGEFPWCIARRFDVDPIQLMVANGLRGNRFYAGQVLVIPQNASPFPGERALHSHQDYTVKAKDTLYKIACWFGDVDPLEIAAWNNLSAPYSLTAGQVLRMDPPSAAPAQPASKPTAKPPTAPTAAAPTIAPTTQPASTSTSTPAALAPTTVAPAQPAATPAAQKVNRLQEFLNWVGSLFGAKPKNTPTPPAQSAAPADTAVPPTTAPTDTAVPPTTAPTDTAVPPTLAPTDTAVPPTLVPTDTAAPPTLAPTDTAVPPTLAPTDTAVPPTLAPTDTAIPPTTAPTDTSVPSTLAPSAQQTPTPTAKKFNPLQAFIQWLGSLFGAKAKSTPVAIVRPSATYVATLPPTPTTPPEINLDQQNLDQALPSDVFQEINYGGQGGGGPFCSHLATPDQFLPYPQVFLQAVSYMGDQKNTNVFYLNTDILVESCGWDSGDDVTATLVYPDGKTESIPVEINEMNGDRAGSSKFFINLDSPAGDYKAVFQGTGGRKGTITLTLLPVDSPRIRSISSDNNLDKSFLYGFQPNESVRLLFFELHEDVFRYYGSKTVQVDQKGTLSVNFQTDKPALVFAIGSVSGKAKEIPHRGLLMTKNSETGKWQDVPNDTVILPTPTTSPEVNLDLTKLDPILPPNIVEEISFGDRGGAGGVPLPDSMLYPPFPDVYVTLYGEDENNGFYYLNSRISVNSSGWDQGDQVTATLVKPNGKTEEFALELYGDASKPDKMTGRLDYFIGYDEPEGEYQVSMRASSGRNGSVTFPLKKPDGPHIALVDDQGVKKYFLYGFQPGESVKILLYQPVQPLRYRFAGTITVQVTSEGRLYINDTENLAQYQVFALGDVSGKAKRISLPE